MRPIAGEEEWVAGCLNVDWYLNPHVQEALDEIYHQVLPVASSGHTYLRL